MKKLAIVLGILALVAIGLLGYAATQANSLITRYKPDIEQAVSSALKADVTLGGISATAFPRTSVAIQNVNIKPKLANTEGLQLHNIQLDVALLPLLTGKLEVVRFLLDKPKLVFNKAGGKVTVEGLEGNVGSTASTPPSSENKAEAKPSGQSGLPPGLSFKLDEFLLNKAHITLNDQDSAKTYEIPELTFSTAAEIAGSSIQLKKLSLTTLISKSFRVEVDSPLILFDSETTALSVKDLGISLLGGRITINAATNLKTQIGEATVSSSGLNLTELQTLGEILPVLNTIMPSGEIQPEFKLQLKEQLVFGTGKVALRNVAAAAGPTRVEKIDGVLDIKLDGQIQNVTTQGLAMVLGAAPLVVNLSATNSPVAAVLNSLELKGFGGSVNLKGQLTQQTQAFQGTFNAQSLQLGELTSAATPQFANMISGTLSSASADLRGVLGTQLMQSIGGNLDFALVDGTLKGVNIAGDVLRAVKNLPFLTGSLDSGVSADARGAIDAKDTAIKKLSGTFAIGAGAMTTRNLKLLSTAFNLDAQGQLGFDANIDLLAEILFEPGISAMLVAKTSELKALQNSEQRLVLPLALKGKAPQVLVLPDVPKIVALATKGALKEKAAGALQKILGGDKKKGAGLFGF